MLLATLLFRHLHHYIYPLYLSIIKLTCHGTSDAIVPAFAPLYLSIIFNHYIYPLYLTIIFVHYIYPLYLSIIFIHYKSNIPWYQRSYYSGICTIIFIHYKSFKLVHIIKRNLLCIIKKMKIQYIDYNFNL